MAAKKNPTRREPNPPKKKPASAADFRKKEEEDKRIARETKRNPKDANGNSYFGPDKKGATPKPADPYKPNWDVPEGTPWKPDSPYNPKNDPKKSPMPKPPVPKSPNKPKTPDVPKTTTTTTVPRGMNQLGKMVGAKQESLAKKKKKK